MPDQDLKLAIQALKRLFGGTIYQRGEQLVRHKAVQSIEAINGDITGVVNGTDPKPYLTSLYLHGDFQVDSDCTCPFPDHCKHAAALGITWLQTHGAQDFRKPRSVNAEPNNNGEYAEDWLQDLIELGRLPAQLTKPGHYAGTSYWLYELSFLADSPGQPAANQLESMAVNFHVRIAKQTKNGSVPRGQDFCFGRDYHLADQSTALDRDLNALGSAVAKQQFGWSGPNRNHGFALTGAAGNVIVATALKTGLTFRSGDRAQALIAGPPVTIDFSWQKKALSHQLNLNAAIDGRWVLIPTEPPWCWELETGLVRPIDTSLNVPMLQHALMAPPLNEQAAQNLASWLSTEPLVITQGMPTPDVALPERIGGAPQPLLLIHSPSDDPHVYSWVANPVAQYEDMQIGLGEQSYAHVLPAQRDDGSPVHIHRDLNAEWQHSREFIDFATRFGFAIAADQHDANAVDYQPISKEPLQRFKAYRALIERRAELEDAGWQLQVLPPVHTRVEQVHDLSAQLLLENPGSSWFELGIGLMHAGKRYDLLPLVVSWLQQGATDESVLTQAEDGTWLEVPATTLAPVAETLSELGDDNRQQNRIRLSRSRALSLDTLSRELKDTGVDVSWSGDTRVLKLGDRLRSLSTATVTSKIRRPRGIKAEMRPYQLTGLGWLNLLAEHQLNGILADDMGLGKTLQTIAHIVSQRNKGSLNKPTLIISPTSLLGNWYREIERFAPKLSARIWHGIDRHEQPLETDSSDVIITSYTLSLRDNAQLAEHDFGLLVLDEAQAIKNPIAKITRAIKSLPIERRLCVTGTPLENHLGELWSQFDFLMPGLLADQTRFTRHFRTPIEKHGNKERLARLVAAIRPFVLRRRKEDVATELPPKTEIVREVRLDGTQAKLYESIRVAMEARVRTLLKSKGLAKSRIEMLDALLKLRQTCCHPDLVKLESARKVKTSAKTEMLLDMLDEMIPAGRRVLIFSQFTAMLSLIENALAERGHRWIKLTGQTRKRDAAIDAFQSGEVPIFLISLKAGGTGLNLTAADTVIHYDPWWNPAVERQASDRAHRIGQTKPVFVYKLVTTGTVEQRIVDLQLSKQALADATIEHDNTEAMGQLSAEDVLSLFAAED